MRNEQLNNTKMKNTPSSFRNHPMSSVFRKSEYETIAQNIMIILAKNGDKFRKLSWKEYKTERLIDGNFSEGEKMYFNAVINYTTSAKKAQTFSNSWKNK